MTTSQAFQPASVFRKLKLTGTFSPVDLLTSVRTVAVASPGASFLTATDLVDVPDGMAIDVGGNLWIAEANATTSVASGRIEIFSPAKKKLGTIPFPTQRPTSVTFGGADGKQLFVTTESSISGGSAGVFTYVSRCVGVK